MKPAKTPTKGKQKPRKKATIGKEEEAARAAKSTGRASAADKGKKSAGTAVTGRGKKSGKDKKDTAREARVKQKSGPSATDASIRQAPAGKIVRSGKTAVSKTVKESPPKAALPAKTAAKSKETASRAARPHIRNAKITGQRSLRRKPLKTGEAGTVLSAKNGKWRSDTDLKTAIKKITSPALPDEYGENEFFLIPVEPRVVYASWEITRDSLPKSKGGLEVRFFRAKQAEYGGKDAHAFLSLPIPRRVGDAFFNVGIHGEEVIAEIGHIGADGHFRPLLRSRRVLIPGSLEPGVSGLPSELSEAGSHGSRPPDKE